MSYEYLYRIVILGDSCSGKTSFMNKYISNEHKIINLPTIGVDFNARIINGPENKKIKVHLWDTSGNKNFRSIARSYFGGVAGAIMLYNVGYRDTFNNLPHWLDDFRLSNRYTDIPLLVLSKFYYIYQLLIDSVFLILYMKLVNYFFCLCHCYPPVVEPNFLAL